MPNPWLEIPLADYEGHMASPAVQQLGALSDLFAEAIHLRNPASVAILGIAGGNGLDRIDSHVTHRTLGLDFNPLYLESVRRRFAHLTGLELHCVDLARERVALDPVQLVHAALVFEHAGLALPLDNAVSLVAPGGALSLVLQLPGDPGTDVGTSGVESIKKLAPHFTLIDPARLSDELANRGFSLAHESRRTLPAGKQFWMGVFLRS